MAFNLLTSFTRRTASSFFNRRSAEQLWKSVFSVSAAGRKKGRGRGARARDLNRGQFVGEGAIRAILPGFSEPPITNTGQTFTSSQPQYLPPDPNRQARILERQQDVRRKKKQRMHPLLRGYTGNRLEGRQLGWPMVDAAAPTVDQRNPVAQQVTEQLKQFQTVCLWMKRRRIMKTIGRTMEIVALMAVGNGQGLAGFATAVQKEPRGAVRAGTLKAIRRLRYIERLDNRTVYQDFFAECQGVRLFGRRVPEGFGLRCHRALKLICQLIGIKDIHIQVEGNTKNYQNITKAFFTALANQETHKELSERTRLLVVEMRREYNYVPVIVAKPEKAPCVKEEELKPDQLFDADELYGQGRYPYLRPREVPFYEYLESWQRKLWIELPFRNMKDVKIRLLADRVVPDFEDETKAAVCADWHKQVLKGDKPLPIGLGCGNVYMREDWQPIEKKKK